MVSNSIFEPEDFVFSKDRSHMILKDRPFETVLDRFLQVLNPLEQKSLPMIRKIEKMLLGQHLDESQEDFLKYVTKKTKKPFSF